MTWKRQTLVYDKRHQLCCCAETGWPSPIYVCSWHAGVHYSHEAVSGMSLTLHDEAGNALAEPPGKLYAKVLCEPASATACCFGKQKSSRLPMTAKEGRLQLDPFKLVSTQEGTAGAVKSAFMHAKHVINVLNVPACISTCVQANMLVCRGRYVYVCIACLCACGA